MFRNLLLVLIFFVTALQLSAQDARMSQWEHIPLLVNPANTGNLDSGITRTILGYANLHSKKLSNSFYNLSIDTRLGKGKWAVGFNGFYSGQNDFSVRNTAGLISVARNFALDRKEKHRFSVGAQLGIIQSSGQVNKTNYNDLIDIRSIRNNKLAATVIGDITQTVINLNVGARYRYDFAGGFFESGVSFYNLQSGFNFLAGEHLVKTKRVRGVISTTFQNQLSNRHSIRFSLINWKEGMYITAYDPVSDPVLINETIAQVTLLRKARAFDSYSLMTRSFKSVGIKTCVNIGNGFAMDISYEQPITRRNYFDVQQFGVGFRNLYNRKKS